MGFGTQAEQRTKLRAVAGHATDTALVSDDLLDLCLDEARREINKHYPLYGVSYFETVAGQYAYAPVLPGDAKGIVRALWQGENCLLDEYKAVYQQFDQWYTTFAEFIPPNTTATTRYGILMADLQQQSWVDALRGKEAKVQWPNTVWLSPEPDTAGIRVYYFYQVDRFATAEDVDDVFVSAYWAYAKYQLHETLAAGNGGVVDVRSDTGMQIKTRAPQHHLEIAKRCHKQFVDSLPILAPFKGIV